MLKKIKKGVLKVWTWSIIPHFYEFSCVFSCLFKVRLGQVRVKECPVGIEKGGKTHENTFKTRDVI